MIYRWSPPLFALWLFSQHFRYPI